MVFAHFRDSAEEISPHFKKASANDPASGIRRAIHGKEFRGHESKRAAGRHREVQEGHSSTPSLLHRSAKEGLDIGEVDLIICYDSKHLQYACCSGWAEPAENGRGKNWSMLQMQGKEENDANKAKDSYEKDAGDHRKRNTFQFP